MADEEPEADAATHGGPDRQPEEPPVDDDIVRAERALAEIEAELDAQDEAAQAPPPAVGEGDAAPDPEGGDMGTSVTRAGDLPLLYTRDARSIENPVATAGVAIGALGVLLLLFGLYPLAVLCALVGLGAGVAGSRLVAGSPERAGGGIATAALLVGGVALALGAIAWYADSSGGTSDADKHGVIGSSDSSAYRLSDKACSKGDDGKRAFAADIENRTDQAHGFRIRVSFTRNGDQVSEATTEVGGLQPGTTVRIRVAGPDAAAADGCDVVAVTITD